MIKKLISLCITWMMLLINVLHPLLAEESVFYGLEDKNIDILEKIDLLEDVKAYDQEKNYIVSVIDVLAENDDEYVFEKGETTIEKPVNGAIYTATYEAKDDEAIIEVASKKFIVNVKDDESNQESSDASDHSITKVPLRGPGRSDVTTEDELREAISRNDDIYLGADIVLSESINIGGYKGEIRGDGHTIKAGAYFSEAMFYTTNDNFDIKFLDVTLDGAEKSRAIYGNSNASKLIVDEGSKIQNCSTSPVGQTKYNAIASQITTTIPNNLTPVLADCHGGAIYLNGEYNDVFFDADTQIINNHIAYGANQDLTVNGGNLELAGGNTGASGGAIYMRGGTFVSWGASFEGNHCESMNTTYGNQGGAICLFNTKVDIKDTNILTGVGPSGQGFNIGGGLYVFNSPNISIADSSFIFDVGTEKIGISGGAVALCGEISGTLDNVNFYANKTRVIHAGGLLDFAITSKDSNIVLNKCTFESKNSSTLLAASGGAVCFEDGAQGDFTFKQCTFTDTGVEGRNAGRLSGGAAISFGTSVPTKGAAVTALIDNCTFKAGSVYNMHAAGGEILIANGNTVTIKNSNFLSPGRCGATYGAAIFNGGKTTLDNVTIDGLYAYSYGGGIYNDADGELTLNNNTVIKNSYAGDTYEHDSFGGGIYNKGKLTMNSATLSGNSAYHKQHNNIYAKGKEYGGSNMYLAPGSQTVIGSDVTFDTGDVRVLSNATGSLSFIQLSGERTSPIYVSISEEGKTSENDMYRYIGYLIAKGSQYVITEKDLENIIYKSKDSNASDDPSAFDKWVFVFNPEDQSIVVGQNAKLIYDANEENFHLNTSTDPSFASGTDDLSSTTKNVEKTIGLYKSANGIEVEMITDKPNWDNGKTGAFEGWYKSGDVPTMAEMKTNNTHTKAFSGSTGTFDYFKTTDFNSDGKVDTLLNYTSYPVVYAAYSPFSVKYEKGSDSTATGMPADSKMFGSETVTVGAAPNGSKTFTNWKVTNDASATILNNTYNPGQTFKMPGNDITLTGQWKDYTVTYIANAPLGQTVTGMPTVNPQDYAASNTVVVASAPSTEGYTFTGWKVTKGNLPETSYQPTNTFIMPTENVELTAQWQINEYDVEYKYTGTVPKGAPSAPQKEGHEYKETVTVKDKPTLEGYTFTGWSTSDVTVSGNTFTMPNKNVKFTGSWSPNTYTVKYDKNTGDSGNVASQTVKYDEEFKLHKNEFVKKNNDFSHWNTKANGSGTSYKEEELVKNLSSVNDDEITLYAIWIPYHYRCIKGHEQVWTKGGSSEAMFKFERSNKDELTFSKKSYIEVDGNKLVLDTDFRWAEGSLEIYLKPSYLSNLANGEHTIKAVFVDGAAEAKFTIKENANKPTNNNQNRYVVPNTGDRSNLGLFGLLFIFSICTIISCSISLMKHLKR